MAAVRRAWHEAGRHEAALVAGRIAQHLFRTMPADEEKHRATVKDRAWVAVTAVSDIVAP